MNFNYFDPYYRLGRTLQNAPPAAPPAAAPPAAPPAAATTTTTAAPKKIVCQDKDGSVL